MVILFSQHKVKRFAIAIHTFARVKKWALLSQFFIESDLMSLMGIEGDT